MHTCMCIHIHIYLHKYLNEIFVGIHIFAYVFSCRISYVRIYSYIHTYRCQYVHVFTAATNRKNPKATCNTLPMSWLFLSLSLSLSLSHTHTHTQTHTHTHTHTHKHTHKHHTHINIHTRPGTVSYTTTQDLQHTAHIIDKNRFYAGLELFEMQLYILEGKSTQKKPTNTQKRPATNCPYHL